MSDDSKIQVYEIIANLILKAIVVLAVIGVWFATIAYTMVTGNYFSGASAVLLGFGFRSIIKHYFPAAKPPKKS